MIAVRRRTPLPWENQIQRTFPILLGPRYLEMGRHIEDTVPLVILMLVTLSGNCHFGHAVPSIHALPFFVETDVPGIRTGTQREHGKSVAEVMLAGFQLQILRSPGPNQPALGVEKRDAMMAVADGLV